MGIFPTPWEVTTEKYIPGDPSNRGTKPATYGPPRQQAVMGWGPPKSQAPTFMEPGTAGHNRVIIDQQLYVPPEFEASAHDRITLPDGKAYRVVGHPMDYTKGPFGFVPGMVVNLKRVEG